MYRDILLDERTPGLDRRPSLFEMSYWHHKHCRNKQYPPGTWDCDAIAEKYVQLNRTYNFDKH